MQFTVGQQEGIRNVWGIVADPDEKYLIIKGPAGTGKSEIIREIARDFKAKTSAISKLTGDRNIVFDIVVAATTNKAVDALMSKGITKHLNTEIMTIFRALKLKPVNGKIVATTKEVRHHTLFIIDESSYADDNLLNLIDKFTDSTCKIVFIGDPFQLPPVGYSYAPVFDKDYITVELDEIMRQRADNPIQKLSLDLRGFVMGEDMPKLVVDNKHIFHVKDEDEFIQLWLDSIEDGKVTKLIGYTNDIVHNANAIAKEELESRSEIHAGDVLICNNYLPHPIRQIKTDAEVVVESTKKATSLGYVGKEVTLSMGITVFVPNNHEAFDLAAKMPLTSAELNTLKRQWADLRANYACTIHKSQGSTYQNVFINLNELNVLNDDDSLSRLLYVAVSRASEKVYFLGEL